MSATPTLIEPHVSSSRAAFDPGALVGETPLLRIAAPFTAAGPGFFAKLEGANPGGIKDRAALHAVRRARARGELDPGARIIESTSGTFGLGLALAGVVLGHPVTLVTDPGLEPMMHNLLTGYGASVVIVAEPHPLGGWQQARREKVAELLAAHPGAWCPDQYHNPDCIEAYTPLAQELRAGIGHLDALVVAVGTGGHSAGLAHTLRTFYPALRVVAVDTIGSTIFGQPAEARLMRGLGSSIHPGNVAYHLIDEVHWVAPAEAVWAARTLARTHFTTGGWSVGAVALVSRWLSATLPATARIATIFPDGPHRYAHTVFDDAYCAAHGLLALEAPEEPEEIGDPGERVVDRWTRCTAVRDPKSRSATAPGGLTAVLTAAEAR